MPVCGRDGDSSRASRGYAGLAGQQFVDYARSDEAKDKAACQEKASTSNEDGNGKESEGGEEKTSRENVEEQCFGDAQETGEVHVCLSDSCASCHATRSRCVLGNRRSARL